MARPPEPPAPLPDTLAPFLDGPSAPGRGDDHPAPPGGPREALPGEADGAPRYADAPPGAPGTGPRTLGKGSFGRVLLVWDRVLERDVAVKELTRAEDPGAVRRFLREARLTARLEHPSIVPVHDLGRRPDGGWYYSMQVVRGRTLADAAAEAPGLAGRLELLDAFVDVCQAVAYAHSRGVLHRDLKPQNVMLGAFGETMVLDWGLASDPTAPVGPDDPNATRAGATLGTPAYMSPEQARGDVGALDTRTDVYGLGAVLHHLLCGRPPHAGVDTAAVLAAAREGAPPAPRALVPTLPPELDSIVRRALAARPEDRYPDPLALAADLRAWRAGRPVSAHRYRLRERLARAVTRHGGVLAAAAVVLAVLAGMALWSSREIGRERDRALAAESVAHARLARSLVARATEALESGNSPAALAFGAEALALAEDPDARGALMAGRSGLLSRVLATLPLPAPAEASAWGPTGELALLLPDRILRWDTGLRPLPDLARPHLGPTVPVLAWSPDGRRLALSTREGAAVYLPADGPDPAAVVAQTGISPLSLAWLDGRRLVVADRAGAGIWDVETGRRLGGWDGHAKALRTFAVAPGGRLLAVGANDHTVHLWDTVADRTLPLEPQGVGAYTVAFSPDGSVLYAIGEVSGGDGRVRTWDVATGRAGPSFPAHRGEGVWVRPSPDGRWVLTGGRDGYLRVFDGRWLAEVGALHLRAEGNPLGAIAPDGERVLVSGSDPVARVWRLGAPDLPDPVVGPHAVGDVDWRGDTLAVSLDGEAVWQTGPVRARRALPADTAGPLVARPDGTWLVVGNAALHVLDGDGALLRTWPVPGTNWRTDPGLSRDGRWFVTADGEWSTAVVDLDDGAVRTVGCARLYGDAAWLDADRAFLSARPGGGVTRVDRETLACAPWSEVTTPVYGMAVAPDGARVAVAADDGLSIHGADGALQARLDPTPHAGSQLGWTPDGRWLAQTDWAGVVRIWDTATGTLRARWVGHRNRIWRMALSADGTRLATAGNDHVARTWRLVDLDTPADALAAAVAAELPLRVVDGELHDRR